MIVAEYAGRIIAESRRTIYLENHHYFPEEDVEMAYLQPSDSTTICPRKGTAYYFDVVVEDERAHDMAWSYPVPKEIVKNIKGYIAFQGDIHVHQA